MSKFKPPFTLALVYIFIIALYSNAAPTNEVPGETLARMKKLGEEYATPNENHAFLNRLSGNWNTSSTVMELPQEEGKAIFEMILGDRFLNGDISGTFAKVPYAGRVTIGYDNFRHKFVATFLDDLGTSIRSAEGSLDKTGNILSLWGSIDEWMTDQHDNPVKYRYIIVDKDQFVFEIYDLAAHPNSVVIKTTYRRVGQVDED